MPSLGAGPSGNAEIQEPSSDLMPRAADRIAAVAYPLGTLLALLVAWEAACRFFQIRTYILPPPTDVLSTMVRRHALLGAHTLTTSIEILVGFLLCVVIGVALALVITAWRPVERAIYPILVISQAVPKVAIAPLFIVWLGVGWEPKVLIGVLIGFFPIVIDLVTGFQSVPLSMRKLALSMGASGWQTFAKFVMPHALPHFFSGLKVAVTLAISGAIIGEFVGADHGLGYLLLFANGQMDTNLLFADIVVLAALGVALFYAVLVSERLCLPWHVSSMVGGGHGRM